MFLPRIPWTEEPGGLQSTGCKEVNTTEHMHLASSSGEARRGVGNSSEKSLKSRVGWETAFTDKGEAHTCFHIRREGDVPLQPDTQSSIGSVAPMQLTVLFPDKELKVLNPNLFFKNIRGTTSHPLKMK